MARKLSFDKVLLSAVVLLLGLGLVMVYSASVATSEGDVESVFGNSPFHRQLIAAVVGLAGMAVAMQVDYRWLRKRWVLYPVVGGVLALLVCALSSPILNASRRWLFVGGVSVQPSEFAKLAAVLFLAYQLDRKWARVNHPSLLIPTGLVLAAMSVLILLQPDFGTAGMVLLISGLMLFLGGLAWRYVVLAGLIALPAFWILVLSVPYRRNRILAFMEPDLDPQGIGFQVQQSLIAVGSGGLFGLGPGQGVQKLHFLPFANSDFIYAIVCEELGLVGALGVLLLFAVFGWRGLVAGGKAPDTFGRFLAWGMTCTLLLQALIHMSISIQLLPTTGIPLPLVSYGGSSLVTSLVASGVLLNVSQHA